MWRSQSLKFVVGVGIVAVGTVAITTYVMNGRKAKRTKIIEMVSCNKCNSIMQLMSLETLVCSLANCISIEYLNIKTTQVHGK